MPGTRILEVGGGLGYITEELIKYFSNIDCVEFDKELFEVLYKKFIHNKNLAYLSKESDSLNKIFIHNGKTKNHINISINSIQNKKDIHEQINNTNLNKNCVQEFQTRLIQNDILEYEPPEEDYILVGNIPFHISGRLYRRFMSILKHKPYAMVFITDKQYAKTLMGQPPRCYRVSLQAQSYGDLEIVCDVPPTSVYPKPKVMSCILKITQNNISLPKNFWKIVNYHFDNFPTPEVESPKMMSLKNWIDLSAKTADPPA